MRIIVITGGSRSIGASAAIEAARRGIGVIVTGYVICAQW